MRILVTGGAGFLGHHLVEHLLKNTDWEVVSLDSLNYSSTFDRLRDIQCYSHERVKHLTHDLSQPLSLGLRRELGDFNYIAHCAAETHVDNSITNPEPFIYSNLVGTFRLLEYARRQSQLKAFCYFSTDEVFGPAALDTKQQDYSHNPKLHFSYHEWDRYNSTNPYSATKAGAEELCLAWANTYSVPVFISHCMNLFGERQHSEKFIPGTVRKVLNGERVTIHSSPDGRPGMRTYLHARNAASAVLFLLKKATPRDKYNIVGQEEIDNLSLAKLIARYVGKPLDYELVDFHSSRPGHDLRYGLSGQKLAGMGWSPPIAFGTSLERTIRWYLSHPSWLTSTPLSGQDFSTES